VIDGQFVDQGQILVHDVDSQGSCVLHGLERHLFAVEQNPARVGRLETAEDLEQGGFAGAVVAEKRKHLPLF
jgi:hypothetical protein